MVHRILHKDKDPEIIRKRPDEQIMIHAKKKKINNHEVQIMIVNAMKTTAPPSLTHSRTMMSKISGRCFFFGNYSKRLIFGFYLHNWCYVID